MAGSVSTSAPAGVLFPHHFIRCKNEGAVYYENPITRRTSVSMPFSTLQESAHTHTYHHTITPSHRHTHCHTHTHTPSHRHTHTHTVTHTHTHTITPSHPPPQYPRVNMIPVVDFTIYDNTLYTKSHILRASPPPPPPPLTAHPRHRSPPPPAEPQCLYAGLFHFPCHTSELQHGGRHVQLIFTLER